MCTQNIVFILTGHSGFYVFFCVEFFMCTQNMFFFVSEETQYSMYSSMLEFSCVLKVLFSLFQGERVGGENGHTS